MQISYNKWSFWRKQIFAIEAKYFARNYLDIANILFHCEGRIAGESFKRIQDRSITRASANITAEWIFDLLHCQFVFLRETENNGMERIKTRYNADTLEYLNAMFWGKRMLFFKFLRRTCKDSSPYRGNRIRIACHFCQRAQPESSDSHLVCFLYLRSY